MTSGGNDRNPTQVQRGSVADTDRSGKRKNPFREMGFIKFWILSTVFCLSFPVSLLVCYLVLGELRTKQLVVAIVADFLLTLAVLIGLSALLVWLIYHYVAAWFA